MKSITVRIPYLNRFALISQVIDHLVDLSDEDLQEAYDSLAIGNVRLDTNFSDDCADFDAQRATFVVEDDSTPL